MAIQKLIVNPIHQGVKRVMLRAAYRTIVRKFVRIRAMQDMLYGLLTAREFVFLCFRFVFASQYLVESTKEWLFGKVYHLFIYLGLLNVSCLYKRVSSFTFTWDTKLFVLLIFQIFLILWFLLRILSLIYRKVIANPNANKKQVGSRNHRDDNERNPHYVRRDVKWKEEYYAQTGWGNLNHCQSDVVLQS